MSALNVLPTLARAQILTEEPTPQPQPTAPPQPLPPPQPTTAPPAPTAAPPPAPTAAPPPALPAPQPAATARVAVEPPAPAAAPEPTTTDHDRFVGHMGAGYMGIAQLPIGSGGGGGGGGGATLNAPVIGVRYWLKREWGLDVGLGFALGSGSVESAGSSTDKPSQLGMAIHGGVPINLAYGKHYVFQIVPEATFGFTTATVKGNPDVSLSGSRIDLGARAGAEIHFGFISLPELALQASIGLFLHREARSATPSGGQSSGDSSMTIATSVQGDPWAIFANNISALYYF
jgi:hypothetical protein